MPKRLPQHRLAVVLLLLAAALTACGSEDSSSSAAGTGECQYADGDSSTPATKPPSTPTATGKVSATLHLSAGDVPLTLDADVAPCTVNSFLSLAEQGYFDDTPCHRLTTTGIFILQCGDPTGTGRGGPGYSFADELGGAMALPASGSVVNYRAGTLAMANAGANTNGSQFFLVYDDSPLAPDYSVFGTLSAEGLEVVRSVAAKGTAADDVSPAEAVTITSVETP
ncbi:MAG: peptidylprolyl isomerase [Nocardioides sp.]|uniref:peptidylprolyl isomerase n=1 Tax=Nocardioides sp. TaxID=35761 RepID=UPI0039E2BB4D